MPYYVLYRQTGRSQHVTDTDDRTYLVTIGRDAETIVVQEMTAEPYPDA